MSCFDFRSRIISRTQSWRGLASGRAGIAPEVDFIHFDARPELRPSRARTDRHTSSRAAPTRSPRQVDRGAPLVRTNLLGKSALAVHHRSAWAGPGRA